MKARASTSDLVCASTPQQCQHHCIGLDGQCITHPRSHEPVCMLNASPTASNAQVSSIRHKLQVAPWQAYRQLQHAKTARTLLRHSPYHKCGLCRSLLPNTPHMCRMWGMPFQNGWHVRSILFINTQDMRLRYNRFHLLTLQYMRLRYNHECVLHNKIYFPMLNKPLIKYFILNNNISCEK